jgi:tetratricopeptide (TPR) repeat protein
MHLSRTSIAAALLVALVGVATIGCGSPPDKEIQQAAAAIDAAKAAGAEQYAKGEYAAAQEALKQARDAVDQRDYQSALNHALDSRERAQNAAKEAADRQASARGDAERAIADLTAALNDARARLKAAESARVASKTLAKPRQAIADGGQALQKARAAFDRGDYLAVTSTAQPAAARLVTVAHDLDAVTAIVGRRRR